MPPDPEFRHEAMNPEEAKKLQDELNAVLARYNADMQITAPPMLRFVKRVKITANDETAQPTPSPAEFYRGDKDTPPQTDSTPA